MELEGFVREILDTEVVSDKFQKRGLVIETKEEKYPQEILIEFQQDKTDLLDTLSNGDDVAVSINMRGKRWNDPKTGKDRFFNTIVGWRVVNASQASKPSSFSSPTPVVESENELPF
mgnify:CR=1 FL=1